MWAGNMGTFYTAIWNYAAGDAAQLPYLWGIATNRTRYPYCGPGEPGAARWHACVRLNRARAHACTDGVTPYPLDDAAAWTPSRDCYWPMDQSDQFFLPYRIGFCRNCQPCAPQGRGQRQKKGKNQFTR
jgi:hypothetical protein